MIEKLQDFMSSKFQYKLSDYAVYELVYKQSVFIPIALSLFGVSFVGYILDAIFGWGIITLGILLILFVLLVILPFALRKGNKFQAIIVTPEYLIQRNSRTEFVAIDFDEIESFAVTGNGIVIKDHKHTIILGLSLSREELDPIIDILEAKGKTFEPEKEYMIRPIEIHIKNNKITIEELEEVTKLDSLYEEIAGDYRSLTPGFVNEIIFRNCNVVGTSILNDTNLLIKLDQFEVKDGHPENTKFDSVIAVDCIVVFQNVKVRQLLKQDNHKDDVLDEKLENNLKSLPKLLEKSNITQWKTGNNVIDFYFATGVYVLKVTLAYENIIIGWNELKE